MARYVELQCDGLVGPTHNYAGLSHGNIASSANAQTLSYPRQAALQGLEKMRYVASLGAPQLVIPPQLRPNVALLQALGFSGTLQEMLDSAYAQSPKILQAVWSASGMWAANMATVSPAPDTQDGRLQISSANLASTLHRQQEAGRSYRILCHLFSGIGQVHAPLPACQPLTDEGAANHMRLCEAHGEAGVEIFVYGGMNRTFPSRQTREASEALARRHGVKNAIFVQQSAEAIDAGVFHNDVIAMSNERLLIYHEKAFADEGAFVKALEQSFPQAHTVRISEKQLPLPDAVASYFFNSQLLSLGGGDMIVIAPQESAQNEAAAAAFAELERDPKIPVRKVQYLSLRESMKNGGGPACLRLRVAVAQEEIEKIPSAFFYCNQLHEAVEQVINAYYPAMLSAEDLRDAMLVKQCETACKAIEEVLGYKE